MSLRVTHFMRRPRPADFSVENVFRDVQEFLPSDIDVSVAMCPHMSSGLLPRITNIAAARKLQGDVNHVTGDVTYLALGLDRRKTITTFLDCHSLERLGGVRRELLRYLWFELPIRMSKLVTVISYATGDRLRELVRCPADKVRVVYIPVSQKFRHVPKEFDESKPTVLHIGTRQNKNLDRHVAALAGIPCRLVVIGPLSDEQLAMLEASGIEYENCVRVPFDEVIRRYIECDFLLFASTYEGFGMPIVEAQSIGRPVITSNVWSMPEIAGDGAVLVDPYDTQGIAEAVRRVIADRKYREELVLRGLENAQRFDRSAISASYADLYREVADQRD